MAVGLESVLAGAVEVGKVDSSVTLAGTADCLVSLLDREYQKSKASKRMPADTRIASRVRIKYHFTRYVTTGFDVLADPRHNIDYCNDLAPVASAVAAPPIRSNSEMRACSRRSLASGLPVTH